MGGAGSRRGSRCFTTPWACDGMSQGMFPKHGTPQRHREKEYCPLHEVKLQILAAMASVSGLRFIDSDVKFPLKINAYKQQINANM